MIRCKVNFQLSALTLVTEVCNLMEGFLLFPGSCMGMNAGPAFLAGCSHENDGQGSPPHDVGADRCVRSALLFAARASVSGDLLFPCESQGTRGMLRERKMKSFQFIILVLLALILMEPLTHSFPGSQPQGPLVRHDLHVTIHPDRNGLSVKDAITVPDVMGRQFRFTLHQGLNPVSASPGVSIARGTSDRMNVPLVSYSVTLPVGMTTFTVTYEGKIRHPLRPYGTDRTGGFTFTPGIVSSEGVFLDGNSFWYPHIENLSVTFSLKVTLPEQWDAVSQGKRVSKDRKDGKTRVRWVSPEPQSEIYLVAGPFTEYSRISGSIDIMVFLRAADDALAQKYLDAAQRYLEMYGNLIGPYPYKKFAIVENFWETGFGMPSFALLGPKVIRFPFILHSSYPHEILHNWWGNGVYADLGKGNWSEGLTAYLADHLLQEQRGDADLYRRDTLRKYKDYVAQEKDFRLRDFKARHSSASQAVGYGKALMFFHMLRQELGDKAFIQGLQDFYGSNKFRIASYNDLRNSLEKTSGRDLKQLFDQWTKRTGAPELKLSGVQGRADGDGYLVTGVLEQIQAGKAYAMTVPVAITMEGQEGAYLGWVAMKDKHAEWSLRVPHKPLRVDIDPQFDLFRKLAKGETPIALSKTFGSENMLFVLPSKAKADLLEAYRQLARMWTTAGPDAVEVKLDSKVTQLPSDRAVTLLGWENRFLGDLSAALSSNGVNIKPSGVTIASTSIPRADHSIALTVDNPRNPDHPVTWVAADDVKSIPGLARKLPHYGKYGYVAFRGKEPENTLKGRWPVVGSSLTAFLSGKGDTPARVKRGALPARKPLVAPVR